MKIDQLMSNINNLNVSEKGYVLIYDSGLYYGIKHTGEYAIASDIDKNYTAYVQSSKNLMLETNVNVLVKKDNSFDEKKLSIITLNRNASKYIEIFMLLFNAFKDSPKCNDLSVLFYDLLELFSRQKSYSEIELQGLYGELFFIYVYKIKKNVDLTHYYQRENYRKFDFSLSEKEKIDVKTTLSKNRTHHFLLEQLNTSRYNIYIASIMLEKDDKGLSLLDLIEFCLKNFDCNYDFVKNMHNILLNTNIDILSAIRYNEDYLIENLRIYNALDIPRIKEKTQDGVYNVKFESDLTNVNKYISLDHDEDLINIPLR